MQNFINQQCIIKQNNKLLNNSLLNNNFLNKKIRKIIHMILVKVMKRTAYFQAFYINIKGIKF